MTYLYFNLLFLIEKEVEEKKDSWIVSILKDIWKEISDMFGDVMKFFKSIYDGLASKFGDTAVTILLSLVGIVAVMIIATAIIRK